MWLPEISAPGFGVLRPVWWRVRSPARSWPRRPPRAALQGRPSDLALEAEAWSRPPPRALQASLDTPLSRWRAKGQRAGSLRSPGTPCAPWLGRCAASCRCSGLHQVNWPLPSLRCSPVHLEAQRSPGLAGSRALWTSGALARPPGGLPVPSAMSSEAGSRLAS